MSGFYGRAPGTAAAEPCACKGRAAFGTPRKVKDTGGTRFEQTARTP